MPNVSPNPQVNGPFIDCLSFPMSFAFPLLFVFLMLFLSYFQSCHQLFRSQFTMFVHFIYKTIGNDV